MNSRKFSLMPLLSPTTLKRLGAFLLFAFVVCSPVLHAGNPKTPKTGHSSEHVYNAEVESNVLLASSCVCPMFEEVEGNTGCNYETDCPSIRERVKNWEVQFSTHPVCNDFSVSINGKSPPSNLRVTIVDIDHRVVMQAGETNGDALHLNAETLKSGQYLIQFSLEGQVLLMKRFIVYRN